MITPRQIFRLNRELREYPFTLIDKETIYFKFKKYTIQLDGFAQYPFHPPRVSVDGKILSYSPSFFPPRLIKEYSKTHKCPCCTSIMCANNWSPSLGIIAILNEYELFIQNLKTFQQIQVFKHVHLPDDMIGEIIAYL